MNKKIILIIAILLIVAVVFVACKGKGDVENTTESTTEPTTNQIVLRPDGDSTDNDIVFADDLLGEGDIIFGDEENPDGDTIDWNEIVGN